jgi:pyrimidine-nucleoside phosphorylase
MMSGRGLGHSGGTLDKLESIPGFRVHLSLEEYRSVLKELGCALIGQSREVAPADRILYALRDVTATVESIPLITASILSKKIAAGIEGLVLDVKCGVGAFMKTAADAFTLARSLVAIGKQNGLKTEALVTAMDVPLGRAVGNALEVKECLEALHGKGRRDLMDLSLTLAARMLILSGLVELSGQAEARVREALVSGRGLVKLRRVIERQGGDPRVVDDPGLLPRAQEQVLLRARHSGHVNAIHAEKVGRACMLLGAGRLRVEEAIDPAVGLVVTAHRGEQVKEGDALAEVHVNDRSRLPAALELLEAAWTIGPEPGTEQPLVLERFA